MTPKEALALLKKSPVNKGEPYLLITVGYRKMLFTHKAGQQFLDALSTAYFPDLPYSTPPILHDSEIQEDVTVVPYPPGTLDAIRLGELLAIPFKEAIKIIQSPDHATDK